MRVSRDRRALIVRLCPADVHPRVDVGADHGHVARAIGAVATEQMPSRMGRSDIPWVIADGLAPFREVGLAVVTGMGALTIAGVLARGPAPRVAVVHATDDPPRLRQWAARHGWRIEAEGLAREGERFAEVIRLVPGVEAATGLELEFGPRLLEGDPLLGPHLLWKRRWLAGIQGATRGRSESKYIWASERMDFIDAVLSR